MASHPTSQALEALMRGCLRAHLLVGVLLLICAQAAAAVDGPVTNRELSAPRDFGYFIGDQIELLLEFDLAADYRLDMDKLPKPKRLTRWIALVDVHVQQPLLNFGSRHHKVRLTFQIVNAPRTVIGAGIPPQILTVVGPDSDFPIVIPAQGFFVSRITSIEERVKGSLATIQSHLPPPALDTRARVLRIGSLVAVVLIALAWLAYAHLTLPFIARSRGPFAMACRKIARLNRGAATQRNFAASLAEAHRAFNLTAGRVVFAHELDDFLNRHQRFAVLGDDIRNLFEASDAQFFGTAPPGSPASMDTSALMTLMRRCRNAERGI